MISNEAGPYLPTPATSGKYEHGVFILATYVVHITHTVLLVSSTYNFFQVMFFSNFGFNVSVCLFVDYLLDAKKICQKRNSSSMD